MAIVFDEEQPASKTKIVFDDQQEIPSVKTNSLFEKTDYLARRGIQNTLDVLNAPFELAGEAIRMPLSNERWQAPTIMQRYAPNISKNIGFATGERPIPAYELPRRLLKGAASGSKGFYSDQPLDVVTDLGFGVALGKPVNVGGGATISPMAAPVQAAERLGSNTAKSLFTGVGKFSGGTTRKLLGSIAGVSDEAAKARIKRPSEIINAIPEEDIARNFAGTMNKLEKQVSELDDQAWKSLLKLKSEPKSKLINILRGLKGEYKITGGNALSDADRKAVSTIDKFISRLKEIKQPGVPDNVEQMLDQRQIREILQSVRRDINWNDPGATPTNKALLSFQSKVNSALKESNPEYAEILEPLAKKTNLMENLADSFGLEKKRGLFTPSNTTAGKITQALDTKKLFSRSLLSDLKNETGKDYLKMAQDYKYAKQFEPGRTKSEGSKRVNLGAGLGSIVGSAIGSLFGGWGGAAVGGAGGTTTGLLAGSYLDRQGGATFAKLIDAYLKAKRSIPSISFGEFLPIAEESLSKIGIPLESIIPAIETSTKVLNEKKAMEFLKKAGGDVDVARKMAMNENYLIPTSEETV